MSNTNLDTALASLHIVSQLHNMPINPDDVRHKFSTDGQNLSGKELLLAARDLGFKVEAIKSSVDRIAKLARYNALPAVVVLNDGSFAVLAQANDDILVLFDPREQTPQRMTHAEFGENWTGKMVLFTSRESVMGSAAKFDIAWFVPAIIKYRKLLGEVLIASLFLQLFALVTPLFFQVIMDKVLVHRSLMTLDVLAIGVLGVTVFEAVLGGLRTYVFSHTTNRIDVELGSKLYAKLLSLPVAYFNARRVGDSVARVRELENIRNFITGNAITLGLDLLFSVIFFGLMLYYSVALTAIVAGSLVCYIGLSAAFTPILKHRLQEKFSRSADNQSFLVESVSNVETIKAMAIEPAMQRRWQNQLAASVSASFRAANVSNLAQNSIGFVSKIVTLLIMWIGARMVMDGTLSIGQLIAFNMLAGRVSTPVLRLSQVWSDWQQVQISIERLGDIMNTPSEPARVQAASLPAINGQIEFKDVTFGYQPDSPRVLNGINVNIVAGEVIGIVGRSGSGKSTLTKLIQRSYLPSGGRVMIDGIDLSMVDPSWLRRQIGVVPQETNLFARSIRENIAISRPSAPMDLIIAVSKIAGCHDFIAELPLGYDTMVGEHGSSLSGGQRQRIAIARALLNNPRVLIFDEATSALDPESESIIQQNMAKICQGRTVIIIAHRLSAVRHANRILVVDKGQIIEQGSHEELMGHQLGAYRRLHTLQVA